MQQPETDISQPLTGLGTEEWLEALEEIAEEHGYFQFLGPRHYGTFLQNGPTLLVTFESIQSIQAREDGRPLGFATADWEGVSHLCLLSDGDTWFRDPFVYAYFDRLIDDGFFEDFDRVVFYGNGPCGYAAAAFSVAAPGAQVIAVQPQATLAPTHAVWDRRFPQMRRVSFTDRFGFAPDMLDAAEGAFVLFDPHEDIDAMHAALLSRSHVTQLRLPHLGLDIESALAGMGILEPLLRAACESPLEPAVFFRLYRARRAYMPFLNNVLSAIEKQKRPYLKALLCANVARRLGTPRYMRKLDMLVKAANEGRLAG